MQEQHVIGGDPTYAPPFYYRGIVERIPSRWFADVVGKPMTAVVATLPPAIAAQAEERGRTRDLQAVLGEGRPDIRPN